MGGPRGAEGGLQAGHRLGLRREVELAGATTAAHRVLIAAVVDDDVVVREARDQVGQPQHAARHGRVAVQLEPHHAVGACTAATGQERQLTGSV